MTRVARLLRTEKAKYCEILCQICQLYIKICQISGYIMQNSGTFFSWISSMNIYFTFTNYHLMRFILLSQTTNQRLRRPSHRDSICILSVPVTQSEEDRATLDNGADQKTLYCNVQSVCLKSCLMVPKHCMRNLGSIYEVWGWARYRLKIWKYYGGKK